MAVSPAVDGERDLVIVFRGTQAKTGLPQQVAQSSGNQISFLTAQFPIHGNFLFTFQALSFHCRLCAEAVISQCCECAEWISDIVWKMVPWSELDINKSNIKVAKVSLPVTASPIQCESLVWKFLSVGHHTDK